MRYAPINPRKKMIKTILPAIKNPTQNDWWSHTTKLRRREEQRSIRSVADNELRGVVPVNERYENELDKGNWNQQQHRWTFQRHRVQRAKITSISRMMNQESCTDESPMRLFLFLWSVKSAHSHQYFNTPENRVDPSRSFYLAKALAEKGITTAITTHNAGNFRKEIIDGIEVHYRPFHISLNSFFFFFKRVTSFLEVCLQHCKGSRKVLNTMMFATRSQPVNHRPCCDMD